MRSEIGEQPAALARVLTEQEPAVSRLADAARARDSRFFYLAARGTSDHAAVYCKYLTEITTGLPVALAAPSVVTLYGGRPQLAHGLVLGISQSGRAADAIEFLHAAREGGALTGCITNNSDSPMFAAVEHGLACSAGPELSLPATKTYTTSLMLVAMLVARYSGSETLFAELQGLPAAAAAVLATEDHIAAHAERYRYMEECVILARGINLCGALETGLKLSETSYLRAHPYSSADFHHGPIAIVDEGYPCILVAPSGKGLASMRELAAALAERGAELIVISDDESMLSLARTPLPIPSVPELLTPIISIIASQLFAYHLARVKGRDPDRPRGLKKVTYTL